VPRSTMRRVRPRNSTRCWNWGGMAKRGTAARTRRGCRPETISPAGIRRRIPGPAGRRTGTRRRNRSPPRDDPEDAPPERLPEGGLLPRGHLKVHGQHQGDATRKAPQSRGLPMFSAPRSIPWFNAPLRSFARGEPLFWRKTSRTGTRAGSDRARPVHQEAAVGCVHRLRSLHWMANTHRLGRHWYA